MSCKIEFIAAPNGEMSKLYGQLVNVTGDQQKALEVYLNAIDQSFDSYNAQGEPTLNQVKDRGLLSTAESMRVQQGPKAYNQISIEDSAIEAVVNQLDNAIKSLNRQLHEGLSESEKQSLRDQMDELQRDKSRIIQSGGTFSRVREAANRHFRWAKSLHVDSEPRDLMMGIKLMDLWDYDSTTSKFIPEDRDDLREKFSSLNDNADRIQDDIISTAYKAIQKRMQRDHGIEATREELENIEDIGVAKQKLLNIGHIDHKLIQYFDVVFKNAKRDQDGAIKEVQQNLSRLAEEIDDPEVILRTDKNGNPIDEFIGPFSKEYYRERSVAKRIFINAIENGKDRPEDQRNKLNKKARKKLYKSLNELETVIDPNKVNDAEYKQLFIDKGIDEEIVEYAFAQAKENVEKYKRDLESYKQYIGSEVRSGIWEDYALEGEDETKYRKRKMRNYRKRNSPFLYYEDRVNEKVEYNYSEGYKFSYSLPTEDKYYDKAFSNLTEAERDFWDEVISTIQKAAAFLPENVTRNIDESFVPKIKKNFIEHIQNNGTIYAAKYAMSDFWDNIRDLDVQELNPSEEAEYEDIFSGIGQRDRAPIRFINDPDIPSTSIARSRERLEAKLKELEEGYQAGNIENYNELKEKLENKLDSLAKRQKDQSFDVIKLTQMFVAMAYNYKNMTEVAGHGELIHRLVLEGNTVDGSEVVSRSGPINVANRLKANVDYLLYGVSRDQDEWKSNKLVFPDNPLETKKNNVERLRIENERDALEDKLENEEISEAEYNGKMEKLEQEYRDLGGKKLVWSKVIDNTLLPFAQLKGMGLNVFAGFRNMTYGLYSNILHAQGGEEFTTDDVHSAFRAILHDIAHRKGKVKNLVDKFGILFEVAEIRYGRDRQADGLNPYIVQSWTEYIGQSLTLVSSMMNETVTDTEGNERSLYEAYDSDGNWKTEEFGDRPEWKSSSIKKDRRSGDKFLEFGNKVKQTSNMIHGDYAKDSVQEIKYKVAGRLVSMFRTWLPEAIAYRFAQTRFDQHLGREVTGFYRHTAETLIDNPRWDTIKTIMQAYTPFMDVNSDQLDDSQVASIRRMMKEMQVITMLTISVIALKASIEDDDESNWQAKVLINQLVMLNNDIGLYTSPTAMIDLAKNPVPASSVITDYQLAVEGAWRHLSDEEYQGDHPLLKAAKATPILKQINTASYQAERVIE